MPKIREDLADLKPYEPGKPEEAVMREFGLERIIKLASNESPYPPFPEVIEVISAEARRLHRYPEGDCFELREALSRDLGVDETRLILGNGSSEVIRILFTALCEPGSNVVFATPSFVMYSLYAQIFAIEARPVPLLEQTHDLAAMAAVVDEKTRLVIVCNPNNPTGTYNTTSEVVDFVRSVPESATIVFDEAYYEYATAEDFPATISDFYETPNIVSLRTFSKIYSLAGLRVGYGVCPRNVVDALWKVKEPFSVDRIAIVAATEALRHQDKVAERRTMNASEMERMEILLSDLGYSPIPSQGNFFLLGTGERSGIEVFDRLQRRGVIVRPGEPIGVPGHIRITIGTPEQNDVLLRELETLAGEGV